MTEQLAIFDPGDGILVPVDGKHGISSGERLKNQRPEVYALVVNGLAEGMGIRALSRATGVHHCTIAAIRDGDKEHGAAIDTAKERTARSLATFVEFASERLNEEGDNIPLAQLPVAMGIATDKLQLLQGAPTSIVRNESTATHESLTDWLEQMRRAIPVEGRGKEGEKDSGRRPELRAPEIVDVDAETTVSAGDHEGKER